jgi:hypothetical protein
MGFELRILRTVKITVKSKLASTIFFIFHLRWCDFMLINTFSTEKNGNQLRPKIKIFIYLPTVQSLRTPWKFEIVSNRADSFSYKLVGVCTSVIALSPYCSSYRVLKMALWRFSGTLECHFIEVKTTLKCFPYTKVIFLPLYLSSFYMSLLL